MKKIFTFLLILTTVCLIAAGCADKGATLPVVESVTLLSLPTKTEYLKDEEFNFAGGKFSVKYTDGEENGGEFMTQTVDIPVTQTDPGDGVWDNGDYAATDVKIVLAKKPIE